MRDDSHAEDQTEIETLDGRRVPIRLIVNPRARHISVRVCPTRREAIATAPTKRHLKRAVAFASERANWIASELARLPQGVSLLPGAQLPLRGAMHELAYEHGRAPARIEPGPTPRLVAPAPDVELFEPRLMRFLKNEARRDLEARVAVHAQLLNVRPSKIHVKDMRSRWGSCTVDGVLSFSWRVVMAPSYVLDYLAAHEVAHLVEMNHSRRFWALVKKCMPDYERGRRWLHEHGSTLHAVGMAR